MAFSAVVGLLRGKRLRRDPVFVFASGNRCGSTLLQRLLNSHPDFLIWGEQNGCLNGVLPAADEYADWAYDKTGERDEFLRRGYDIFAPNLSPPPAEVRRATAGYVEALFSRSALAHGKHVWGFKEVRYPASIALLLQEFFPDARFIHLTRRLDDCVASLRRWEEKGEWRREWTRQSIRNWIDINRSFISQGNALRALLSIRYEDMVAAPQAFVGSLASFLEEPAPAFDLSVFSRRLGGSVPGEPAPSSTEEDRRMLSSDEILSVHRDLKY